ncbi:MAG: ABC transporter permease [Bacteroidota bacterium]
MKAQPPHKAIQFLRWFCRADYIEEIEGDLTESFGKQFDQSNRRANLIFFCWVLRYFRPAFLKSFQYPLIMNFGLIKHDFIITSRTLWQNKTTFFINLIGLSTGLACAFLIYLWVQDESQMDKFHANDAHLYQVMRDIGRNGETQIVDWAPGPLAEAIRNEIPGIKYATAYKTHPILGGGIVFEDQSVRAIPMYADQSFLDVFSYPLLHGDKRKVLADKYAALISEELAVRLFGTTAQAIGKVVSWNKKLGDIYDINHPLTIKGVFQRLPANSTVAFDVILNLDFYIEYNPGLPLWTNDQATAAIVLEPGVNLAHLEAQISQVSNSHTEYERKFVLKQYSSLYLYNQFGEGGQRGGRITYVWLFSIIALLILLIAGINYMNLSTARASIRLKEIAVKKTLGASQKSLIFQFVKESLLIASIALLLAIGLIVFFLPFFNQITGKEITLDWDLRLLATFTGIALFTGLLSSTYPALYLSSFRPIQIFRNKLSLSGGETWIRKGLVVFQFTISTFFIVAVLVIYQQMSYVNTKNLGFEKDHILRINVEGALVEKVDPFLREVRKLPKIVQASSSNHVLFGGMNWTTGIDWDGRAEGERIRINPIVCNHYFVETYDLQIKKGRSFSPEYGTDTAKVILNEAAVKAMGLENPLGQSLTFWGSKVSVVGVAEDFHFESLYKQVGPCIIKLAGNKDEFNSYIWIKIRGGEEKAAIESVKQLYAEFNPGYTFEYGFVDETYAALYASENRVAALSKYFSILAILISCLGLFGLVEFTSERRNKEISIRKILGASEWSIVRLLSLDFSKMIILSIVIAVPISYWIAQRWLESFAYKIELAWWFFGASAFSALLIAWLTVAVQTLKAARTNPVQSIRNQ